MWDRFWGYYIMGPSLREFDGGTYPHYHIRADERQAENPFSWLLSAWNDWNRTKRQWQNFMHWSNAINCSMLYFILKKEKYHAPSQQHKTVGTHVETDLLCCCAVLLQSFSMKVCNVQISRCSTFAKCKSTDFGISVYQQLLVTTHCTRWR